MKSKSRSNCIENNKIMEIDIKKFLRKKNNREKSEYYLTNIKFKMKVNYFFITGKKNRNLL